MELQVVVCHPQRRGQAAARHRVTCAPSTTHVQVIDGAARRLRRSSRSTAKYLDHRAQVRRRPGPGETRPPAAATPGRPQTAARQPTGAPGSTETHTGRTTQSLASDRRGISADTDRQTTADQHAGLASRQTARSTMSCRATHPDVVSDNDAIRRSPTASCRSGHPSPDDLRQLAASRPSIPQDLDRAMLMDASDAPPSATS